MKNILYIGNKLASKGATVSSIETLGELLETEGFKVTTASGKKNQLLRLGDMLWQVFLNSKKTDYVLIDTYSTNNFWYAYAIANACKVLNLRYIPILRGGNLPQRIKSSALASNFIFGNAYINVAPSYYLFYEFKNAGFSKLKFIPNTIEIKQYPFLLRKEIRPKLLWVRAFASLYNPMLAIETLQGLLKKYPGAELCMVGPEKDGSLKKCGEFAEKEGLPVTFTGKLEKEEWISLSTNYDIFINTTNFDNTPVSVMEAMALGLPVISTNVGGLPFLLDNGVTGILVEPNDSGEFIFQIEKLLFSPKKSIEISTAARAKSEKFDWETVKWEWNSILT